MAIAGRDGAGVSCLTQDIPSSELPILLMLLLRQGWLLAWFLRSLCTRGLFVELAGYGVVMGEFGIRVGWLTPGMLYDGSPDAHWPFLRFKVHLILP